MLRTIIGVVLGIAIAVGAILFFSGRSAKAGPNGGDVVALADGTTIAELLASADTGGLMIHTWDRDLKHLRPIGNQRLTIGDSQHSVDLEPYPVAGDPPGFSSRFYGHADWARGGGIHTGWIHQNGLAATHQDFAWRRCWKAGQRHGNMWTELGAYRDAAVAHGPGRPGMARDMHNNPIHD